MGERTAIEWADATFNPWIGCTKVSPGCDHCYAERDMDIRHRRVTWGAGNPRVRTGEANWNKPRRWNRANFVECGRCGWRGELPPIRNGQFKDWCACGEDADFKRVKRRVFCASLADVFDNEIDPGWRTQLFHLIGGTPNLDWLLLTKRIGNADAMIEQAVAGARAVNEQLPLWPWSHVGIGATIVNQPEAVRDVPKLLATHAAWRFVSIEPNSTQPSPPPNPRAAKRGRA